jgi:hypothetical protein
MICVKLPKEKPRQLKLAGSAVNAIRWVGSSGQPYRFPTMKQTALARPYYDCLLIEEVTAFCRSAVKSCDHADKENPPSTEVDGVA